MNDSILHPTTQPKLHYLIGKRQELIEMLLINVGSPIHYPVSTRKYSNGLRQKVFSTRGYDQKQEQAAAGISYWPHPRQQRLRALSLYLSLVLSHTQRSKRPSPLSRCQPPRQRQHLCTEILQITFLTSNTLTMVGKAWKNYRRRQETLDLRHFCLSMVLIQTCRGSDDEANKTVL